MTTGLGRPAVNDPRAGDLRELVQIVQSIRGRLVAIEAALSLVGAAARSAPANGGDTSAAAAFLRSLAGIANGLLVKVASNTMAARTLQVPLELVATNADGVGGNPTLTWASQAGSQVFASPMGYPGTPSFRTVELASPDFTRQGSLGTMLHGNEYGEPFWGPVELSFEVMGILPAHHLLGSYPIDITGGALKLTPVARPVASTSNGEEGQVSWDGSYFYLCLGPYTWRRVPLSVF